MSVRVKCKCGNIISTGSFPNKYVYSVISEKSYDDQEDPFDRTKVAGLFVSGRTLIECEVCGRIMIQNDSETLYYKLEDRQGL